MVCPRVAYQKMNQSVRMAPELVLESQCFSSENKIEPKNSYSPAERSTKNGKDTGYVIKWNAICIVFLQLRMVEFTARQDNELASAMTFLKDPTTICYLVLEEFVQGQTFDVDSLHTDGNMKFYIGRQLYKAIIKKFYHHKKAK